MSISLKNLIDTVITADEKVSVHAQNLVMRIREVESYQINIDNFNAILAKLPQGEWPEQLAKYKGVPATAFVGNVPEELQEAVAEYNYRDYLVGRLITEKAEQAKSQAVLEAHYDAVEDKEALASKVQAVVATPVS